MKLLLALLLLAANCFAQQQVDSYIAQHKQRHTLNPDGVLFTLRLKDNRKQFQQGERITLELSFSASKPKTFVLDAATYDRSGRLDIDYFKLDRPSDVVDPLDDYFHSGLHGFVGGGLRSIPDLTDKPHIITADLNEWMRFDKPGQYRLYAVSTRVGRKGEPSNYFSNDPVTVVSDVVEFEIVPADKKWAERELAQAIAALSKPTIDHRPACRTMRFLGTAAAVSEMRKRFRDDDRDCEWEYKFGLIGSPHRALAIRDMENAISSPEQPITSEFLSTLALLEFMRQAPAQPPFPDGPEEQVKEWRAQMERRRNAYDQLRVNYLRQLVLAIPQKQAQARATSLETILDDQSELNPKDAAQWTSLLASMSEVLTRLPGDAQVRVLTYQWKSIASPAMLPVLRGIINDSYDKPSGFSPEDLRSIALRRLTELSPDEGRRLILAEIRRPEPRVNATVLHSLPDETLPELEDVLATNFEQTRGPNSHGNSDAISQLIERYATAAIYSRVRTVFEAAGVGRWACRTQSALLAYFLRVDPAFGEESLKKALAARGKNFSGCYTSTLRDVASLHMSAEVEDAATASLDDEDFEVATQAVSLLGEYGSAQAEKALWLRLEKWHEAMESRSEELRKQNPGLPSYTGTDLSGQVMIEQALRNALAYGRGWLADPEKLKRVRDLCITDRGRDEMDQLIQDWSYSINVAMNSFDGEIFSLSVAHYSSKSLKTLKEKLVQFPKGTVFTWRTPATPGDDSKVQEVFREIKSYLEDHGMKLESQ